MNALEQFLLAHPELVGQRLGQVVSAGFLGAGTLVSLGMAFAFKSTASQSSNQLLPSWIGTCIRVFFLSSSIACANGTWDAWSGNHRAFPHPVVAIIYAIGWSCMIAATIKVLRVASSRRKSQRDARGKRQRRAGNSRYGVNDMTQTQAIAAAKQYLLAWHRLKCSDFEAEYWAADTLELADNRATWRVTFGEPSLSNPEGDVAWVYVDELTGEVWEFNYLTGVVSPRSWHDAWAVQKVERAQKAWAKQIEDYQKRQ